MPQVKQFVECNCHRIHHLKRNQGMLLDALWEIALRLNEALYESYDSVLKLHGTDNFRQQEHESFWSLQGQDYYQFAAKHSFYLWVSNYGHRHDQSESPGGNYYIWQWKAMKEVKCSNDGSWQPKRGTRAWVSSKPMSAKEECWNWSVFGLPGSWIRCGTQPSNLESFLGPFLKGVPIGASDLFWPCEAGNAGAVKAASCVKTWLNPSSNLLLRRSSTSTSFVSCKPSRF